MASIRVFEVGMAVDFGMTGSVVSWNEADNPEEIHTIEDWPGAKVPTQKVPTEISLNQDGEVGSWGFLCNKERDSIHTKKLFKVFLDSTLFESPELKKFFERRPEAPAKVAEWVFHFLCSLIGHAIDHIGNALRKKVEYTAIVKLVIHCVLSTPTTWDANTNTTFYVLAQQAIRNTKPTYAVSVKTIKVDITEPDAVGNYILHSELTQLHHGQRFLVLDVGGATSDPCFCQVVKDYGYHICMVSDRRPPFRGITYGCVDIDETFESRVTERLTEKVTDPLGLARQMRDSPAFQQGKTYYRHDMPSMEFPIPGLNEAITSRELHISQGRMIFTEFNTILDTALVDHLESHTSEILSLAPGPLDFIALAGGGSSMPYVAESVENFGKDFGNTDTLLVSDHAAVAKGCLIKWNMQLLRMTVIVRDRDTPPQRVDIGTSLRTSDVITHTWHRNTFDDLTVHYSIKQDLFENQGSQEWEIKVKTGTLAPPLPREVRVDLRLPKISPYVSSEDFMASSNGIQLECEKKATYPG